MRAPSRPRTRTVLPAAVARRGALRRALAPCGALALALAALAPRPAGAQQIIQDNFTGASSSFNWVSFGGACLTAGNNSGTIPACVGLPYYQGQSLIGGYTGTLPDPVGNGALRFTNGRNGGSGFLGGYNQYGGVLSNFTFPTGQGLQVTFTTITYRGDSGGSGGDGADGISFMLLDGANSPYDLGAFGGSLGYDCSNTNNDTKTHPDGTQRSYDGVIGGYIGLGVDEYGNFLNQGDNAATGYNYVPGRIGLRGAGNIAWKSLNAAYPLYYPATLTAAQRAAAVQNTCKTGKLWNYAIPAAPVQTTTSVLDYPAIANAYKVLPSTLKIANESAVKRGDGVPITYKLKITPNGLLSFSYSYNGGAYQSVLTGQNITTGNGALPSSFRFGFAGSDGGSNNVHEVLCFQAQPADASSSSAGLNDKQTAKVQTGTQVYFAYYNPTNWAGSLTSQNLVVDSSTGLVSVSPTANWDASCVLTGVASGQSCLATGQAGPLSAESSSARTMLSWNGTTGIPFQYSNLTATQQSTITAGDASPSNNRVNYLRGDRSNEVTLSGTGLYRPRASILGDIVNSSPTWVGPPSLPYGATWSDALYPGNAAPENSGQTYPAFASAAATRLNVIYAGANDGLLHGFRTGSYDASHHYVAGGATPNDGYEVLAYMPGAVVNTIHSATDSTVDFSNTQYGHAFYIDATPGTGDLYYRNAWHTWVVGGLGAGGQAIYALDVTDPTQFQESNASTLVVGEWNSTTLTCVNASNCNRNLGNTYGVPQVRRFHNGAWGVVFGNGFGSAAGLAGIYVMLVDPVTGAQTFYWLQAGSSATGNGIAYATPADLDGDHVVDYVYAGDLLGNVWRFDLTSSDPTRWRASSGPLFTTPSGQPITTKVVVAASALTTGGSRVVISFGTGQQVPLTNTSPTTYASGQQALYGIWDWNMASWNALSSIQYASLSGSNSITLANLTQQTVLTNVPTTSGYRAVSQNPVCWYGSTTCTASNTSFGWYLNLPGSNEQVIYNPVLEVGAFLVNTTIPPNNNPLTCLAQNASGWTMAISPITGASFTTSFFGDQTGHFVGYNGQVVSGVALSGTGSVSIVTTTPPTSSPTAPSTFLVTQTTSGVGVALPVNPTAGSHGSRLTWVQRR
jgi:type IV pilus assembly protein PilY1